MEKKEMNEELSQQLVTMKAYAEKLKAMIDNLELTVRQADVTFSGLDLTKDVLKELPELRESVTVARRVMKARAQARMKDIG